MSATTTAQLELDMHVPEASFAEGKHAFFESEPFKDLCSDPDDPMIRNRVRSLLASYGMVNCRSIGNSLTRFANRDTYPVISDIIAELFPR
ncbi:MAG: hypothetical protein RLY66_366 [Candidatus Parcubacteria bacterium]|jgi:hypothetical protein